MDSCERLTEVQKMGTTEGTSWQKIKISRREPDIILCRVLSEFRKHIPPLPCNVCISVTSEHRYGDRISKLLDPRSYCRKITFE